MATQTKNYGLTKPDINDFYDVGIDNNNMDTIDTELKNLKDKVFTAGDMSKSIYDKNNNGIVDNAEKVNNHTVEKDVPTDAKFTDTITPIANNLTETIPGKALDAMQGKLLSDGLEQVNDTLSNLQPKTDNTLNTNNKTVSGAINEVFTSASNGKAAVAFAITGMGGQVASDASYDELCTAINNLSKDCNAINTDILAGKTAYVGGKKITGNMNIVTTNNINEQAIIKASNTPRIIIASSTCEGFNGEGFFTGYKFNIYNEDSGTSYAKGTCRVKIDNVTLNRSNIRRDPAFTWGIFKWNTSGTKVETIATFGSNNYSINNVNFDFIIPDTLSRDKNSITIGILGTNDYCSSSYLSNLTFTNLQLCFDYNPYQYRVEYVKNIYHSIDYSLCFR
ncbi:MAG: hypothetical protein VB095_12810 [Anaerovorax sp.]|nr:hypothetical protein [Anaerovorax sp.]